MSCIELKHSNLYRHFCKLGELAWGQKMPQNTSARSAGHAESSAWRGLQKIKSGPGAGIPWRPGRYFQIVSSFCAFSTLFVIERKVQQWFFEVLVYSKHTSLVGHWLRCGSRKLGSGERLPQGGALFIHNSFKWKYTNSLQRKNLLLFCNNSQPTKSLWDYAGIIILYENTALVALENFVRTLEINCNWLLRCMERIFKVLKISILSDRVIFFFSFLCGVGSMTIPSPKRWWEGSGFVKSPCFPQGVSVTNMDTRLHVPLKLDMLQILWNFAISSFARVRLEEVPNKELRILAVY